MKLQITRDCLIKELQDSFTTAYPFLKIEFFKQEHGFQQASAEKQRLPAKLKISEAGKGFLKEGEIELSDLMTVGEFERDMQDRFGLSMQVFRKSGNIWLETTMTDSWTLKQQNDHGKEISGSYDTKQKYKNEEIDYDSIS